MRVLYHLDGQQPVEYVVLKEHGNALVDIGPEGGPAVVTQCAVLKQAMHGHCTLVIEETQKPAAETNQGGEANNSQNGLSQAGASTNDGGEAPPSGSPPPAPPAPSEQAKAPAPKKAEKPAAAAKGGKQQK
jgi:hypothetical protein